MGNAGLLAYYYSEAQQGLTQARLGQNRSRIGAIDAGVPAEGHKNEASTLIVPLYLRKQLGETGYLTSKLLGLKSNESPNIVEEDASSLSFGIGYENFFAPNAMYAVQLEYKDFSLESSAIELDRKSLRFRFDYAHKLSNSWGFHGRTVYSDGENDLAIETPVGNITESQPDDSLYLEANLVGTFKSDMLDVAPRGWVFHPLLGSSFQRNWSKDTTNSVGALVEGSNDDTGSIVALAKFAKDAAPGAWSPYVELGGEYIYKDDLDAFSDENTYVIGGFGLTHITKSGTVLATIFQRRQGVEGNRSFNELVLGANFSF